MERERGLWPIFENALTAKSLQSLIINSGLKQEEKISYIDIDIEKSHIEIYGYV